MENNQAPANKLKRYFAYAAISCAVVVSLLFWVAIQRQRVRQEAAREAAERRLEAFTTVKNGESFAMILDPQLVSMLADDSTCVANLTEIRFDMIDIPPSVAQDVQRLANVSTLGFYDARGAEHVIKNVRELPIENLYFIVTPVSDSTLKQIADFPRLQRLHFEQNLPSSQLAILESFPERVVVHTVQDLPNRDKMAAKHPMQMQPSGDVGRLEVDDQPSPPADR